MKLICYLTSISETSLSLQAFSSDDNAVFPPIETMSRVPPRLEEPKSRDRSVGAGGFVTPGENA